MNPYLVDDEAPTAPAAPAQAALPKAVARNPYLVDEEGETRGHAALAVSLQTEDNPDTAAQHLAIAKRYKTTPDVVARFSPEFKQRIALEMAQQTLASAPKLAARLSNNPQAGALLHDVGKAIDPGDHVAAGVAGVARPLALDVVRRGEVAAELGVGQRLVERPVGGDRERGAD